MLSIFACNSSLTPIDTGSTFDEYIQHLPTWERLLLTSIETTAPPATIANRLREDLDHQPAGAWAVPDGSVKRYGTFGWTIALSGGTILVKGKGWAFGRPMDSYRAEAFGILAIMLWIHHLFQYVAQETPPIRIRCDNLAVVKRANIMKVRTRPTFANDTTAHSWDVLQAIVTTWKRLHPASTLDHVKGHQDNNTSRDKLSIPARMNCLADELAGSVHQQDFPGEASYPLIGGAKCHLLISGTVLSTAPRKKLRSIRPERILRERLQKQLGVSDSVFNTIDWDSSLRAKSRSKDIPELFLSKFLHRLLAVGRVIERYDPILYTNECPSCGEENEDQTHLFRCPDEDRQKWQGLLLGDLRSLMKSLNTSESLLDVVIAGLHSWFNDTSFPFSDFPESLQPLLESQEAIGWEQLLYGRWSLLWREHQSRYLKRTRTEETLFNGGVNWLGTIIKTIWQRCHKEWLRRNEDKHGHNECSRIAAALEKVGRKLDYLYGLRDRCHPIDRTRYFYPTVEEHKRREPSAKDQNAWVEIHEPMILRSVKARAQTTQPGQQTIDEHFPAA